MSRDDIVAVLSQLSFPRGKKERRLVQIEIDVGVRDYLIRKLVPK
jgi:hypothetical protein